MYKEYIIAGVLLVYSIALWNVSARYNETEWLAEKQKMTQDLLDRTEANKELADTIGLKLDERLSNIQIVNKTINQKVIHEVTKETIYSTCRNTPNGVRLIEEAIGNKGQSTSK